MGAQSTNDDPDGLKMQPVEETAAPLIEFIPAQEKLPPGPAVERLNWPLLRAHLCTLAVSMSLNATWRVPRDAFRYGGLAYGLVLTASLITVALPATLLQLSIGHLSQQDAVGVWKAVPFCKGIGYLRIAISYISSTYLIIYVSISIAYLLYSASNTIPFSDCIQWTIIEGGFENETELHAVNASECLSNTFLSPVAESPEYYLAIAFVCIVLWIACPFVFFKPAKLMKRIFYALGPAVIGLGILTMSCLGKKSNISTFVTRSDWDHYLEPNIWHSGIVQALWSCQIAGGFLISAGDSVYSNTNVKWTSVAVVTTNIISSWFWLLFWFAISGSAEKDTGVLAVLLQTYQSSLDGGYSIVWSLLVYGILILSGVISLLTLLYPVYDRLRRIGGIKWRLSTFACSLAGAGVSMTMLVGRLPVFTLLEDIAVPALICIATVFEILAFDFIYGWKSLTEDIEFLVSSEVPIYWVWGWWVSPAVVAASTAWWMADIFIRHSHWSDPLWEAVTVLVTGVVALLVLAVGAGMAVMKQVQYDCIDKLKSSFQPSRHWGPRDPITHYYWLARRDGVEQTNDIPRSRYNRRELGQLSRRPSILYLSDSAQTKSDQLLTEAKKRSNSDDWVYTIGRKEYLSQFYRYVNKNRRSKSLDWEGIIKMKSSDIITLGKTSSNIPISGRSNRLSYKNNDL